MNSTKKWAANVRKVTPYVPGEQPQEKNIIKLNTNENPYPPSPKVFEVHQKMDVSRFALYPELSAASLRDALAEYHGISDKEVFVGVGSDDVLSLAFLTFFNSGKPVLFPDITYSFYPVWAEVYRIPYECPALRENFTIDSEDYKGENGGVVIANPNAPTSISMAASQVEEIIQANPEVVVIIDEAYVDFGGESCLGLIEKYDNLLVVQTFSKSRAMAGMRIGFAMGSPKLIACLKDVKFAFNSYTMNMPSIELGVEAVKDAEYFRNTVNKIMHTRERVKKELSELGFVFPDSQANFIFASHEKTAAKVIFEELKKRNIFVRFWDKPRIGNYLRITVGTDEQMDVLLENLKEIIAVQAELKGV